MRHLSRFVCLLGLVSMTFSSVGVAVGGDHHCVACQPSRCPDGGMTFLTEQPQFDPNQLTPPGLQTVPAGHTLGSGAANVGFGGSGAQPTPLGPTTAQQLLNDQQIAQQITAPKVGVLHLDNCCECADPEFCPPPPPCYHWSFEADAILFNRTNPNLGNILPTATGGTYTTNESFDQGFGPRIRMMLNGIDCHNVDVIYFGTDSFDEQGTIDIGLGTSPTKFQSALHSSEFNFRRFTTEWNAISFGFRFIEFNESLRFNQFSNGLVFQSELSADNYIYALQLGDEVTLWNRGGLFRLDMIGKAAAGWNAADYQYFNRVQNQFNTQNHERYDPFTFVGQVGCFATLDICKQATIRGGYEAMWINGVATAVDALQTTRAEHQILFHGARLGLEMRW